MDLLKSNNMCIHFGEFSESRSRKMILLGKASSAGVSKLFSLLATYRKIYKQLGRTQ